jgi:DNA-binding transcriptional regulator YiaG
MASPFDIGLRARSRTPLELIRLPEPMLETTVPMGTSEVSPKDNLPVAARPRLSGAEVTDALESLELNQTQFATLLDVGRTTVYRWCKPGAIAPGYVSILVRLLLATPNIRELINAPKTSRRGRPRKVHLSACPHRISD